MKFSSRRMADLKASILHIPVVSIALLVAALGSTWLAAAATKSAVQEWRTHAQMQKETPKGLIKATKRPVTDVEMQQLITTLKANHPGLDITSSASPGSLSISASKPDMYRDWMAAIGTVQGAGRSGSIWLATSLCVGDCAGVTMRAELQGIVQSISKDV